ncbi:hypothetical protein D3C80_584820 [compost metagenome]
MTQPAAGRLPVRHQLAGVLVAQLAQVETTTGGDAQGLLKQGRRVQLGQLRQRSQVPLAVGKQALAGFGHRAVMTDRGHAVLQGPPPTGMHVHIARSHGRNVQGRGQRQQLWQAHAIVGAAVQPHRQPQTLGKACA